MNEEPADSPGEQASAKDPDELRRDIEETREELGDTVDALSAKADVKGRAMDAVSEQIEQLADRTRQQPLTYLGVAAGVGFVVGAVVRGR